MFAIRRFSLPISQTERIGRVEDAYWRDDLLAKKFTAAMVADQKLLMPRHGHLIEREPRSDKWMSLRPSPMNGYAAVPRSAMTAQTLAYMKGTEFALTGTPGRISPQDMEDLTDTLNQRTGGLLGGGSFVRVTDPEFGADATGATDSTTAFQNAMAAGPCIVPAFQPGGTTKAVYMVNNCIVPNGAVLIGESALGYVGGGVNSDVYMRPRIIGTPAAVRIFNVDSKKANYFRGLQIDGLNATTAFSQDGISAGCNTMTIENCLIMNCNAGVGNGNGLGQGGSTATFPTASWVCHLKIVTISQCITGFYNAVDSWAYFIDVFSCGNGVLSTGMGSTVYMGCRYEWCGRSYPNSTLGYGLQLAGGENLDTIVGGLFDANGEGGAFFNGADWNNMTGVGFMRNGANPSAGTTLKATSSHIRFNGAYDTVVTGCVTRVNSDGTVYAPAHVAQFDGAGGNNGAIMFTANDLSGYQGSTVGATLVGPTSSSTTWYNGTLPTGGGNNGHDSGYVLTGNFGTGGKAADVDNR